MWIGTDLNYFGNNPNQILVSVTNMYKNFTHIFCVRIFQVQVYLLYSHLDETGLTF